MRRKTKDMHTIHNPPYPTPYSPVSSAATIAYAAAAAAPPTISVLNAPQMYPPAPCPAPVMRALTAPKMRRTTPVSMHE